MKLLITGAGGQLGQALQTLLKDKKDIEVFPFGSKELDITDEALVKKQVTALSPDIIINCAAHTAVDACEGDGENAYRINALGAKYLAMAANAVNASMVQVSTDYVFDGSKETPYVETDTPNPQSIYGKTKLAGEIEAARYLKRLYIVRSAWLYGHSRGFIKPNFILTMLRLAREGKPIRVVNDQYGTPTSHLELARAILYLITTKNYGIYHATCEGSATWYEFAREIFTLLDLKVDLTPITSREFPTAAKRPPYSVLENQRLHTECDYYMADWRSALMEYLKDYERI
jgi:dTDP-4-dehydrorhamnose reductase